MDLLLRRQQQKHHDNNIKSPPRSPSKEFRSNFTVAQMVMRLWPFRSMALLVALMCLTLLSLVSLNKSSDVLDIQNANTTYGHIHMAKTGGTTLNGFMALKFERVCGHKGYSYDYFQANNRFKGRPKGKKWEHVEDSLSTDDDAYSNRGSVPFYIMNEIGYEDCDWISQEKNWSFWPNNFGSWHHHLELHLPCRDPIEHLMSQCNYWKQTFNCNATNIEDEIDNCDVWLNRFSLKLAGMTKCYDYNLQFTSYMKLMSQTLQSRRITGEYVHRSTNNPRNKTNECIWNAPEEFRQKVNAIMVSNYDYYSFCDRKVCVSIVSSISCLN